MNNKRTYFTLLLLFYASFLCILPQKSRAQNTPTQLGISAGELTDVSSFIAQLPELSRLGITVLELTHPVDERLLEAAEQAGMQVLVRSSWQFLTAHSLNANRQEFLETSRNLKAKYERFPAVSAIGLYSYSASFEEDFVNELNQLLPLLRQDSSRLTLYELSTQPEVALRPLIEVSEINSEPNYGNVLFSKVFAPTDFESLTSILTQSPQLLFFDYSWFSDATQSYPPFVTSLRDYQLGEPFLLPLPTAQPPLFSNQWLILFFVLVLLSLGIHIYFSPSYKSLIFRYFTFHRFFVDDVMRYRERSPASGIVILVQHALLFGLMIAILAQQFISPVGLASFFDSLPALSIFGQSYFSLFFLSVMVALGIEIVGLLWLFIPSSSMKHFSQVINLYAWVFHLDFLLLASILVLFLTQSSYLLIIILSIAFLLNWQLGFYLASTDSAGYLFKGKVRYIIYTFGLHTLINIALIILLFIFPAFFEIIQLAVII